jgi:hypothetical protein
MGNLLSPQVKITEAQPAQKALNAVESGRTAFVGVTERGPINQPILVSSFDEFIRIFGGYTPNSELPQTVQAFFLSGGRLAYIVRITHVTDVNDPDTTTATTATINIPTAASAPTPATLTGTNVQPFSSINGATLTISVDGDPADTATINATAAQRTSVNTQPFVLANNQTLTFTIDGVSKSVTFLSAEFADITNATAQEVVNVINAKATGQAASVVAGAVRITSDTLGTSSSVEVTGGTAAAAFAFPVGADTGTGNVADVTEITGAELVTILEADIAGIDVTITLGGQIQISSQTTGPSSSLQVSVSNLQTTLGLSTATTSGSSGAAVDTLTVNGKTPGSYANTIQVAISNASNGDTNLFNLLVLDDGLAVTGELFANLSADPLSPNFIENIINNEGVGSNLISVEALAPSTPNLRPANGTYGPLTGGGDGLASLADTDFIGGKSTLGATGLRALDRIEDVSMLTVPGRATAAMHNAMITYCEVTREGALFTILDPPANMSAEDVITYFDTTAAVINLSEFACTFWPRPLYQNPNTTVFGNVFTIPVPPSGPIAGRFVKTDTSIQGGVYLFSGNTDLGHLTGAVGLESDQVKEREARDLIYPKLINPIRMNKSGVVYLDGTKTLRADSNFPRIAQRRGAILIEQTIKIGMEPFLHKPNTPALRSELERIIDRFLRTQMALGAFKTNDPATAFFVTFSDGLNPDATVEAGQLNGKVGLAFSSPTDFIVIEFSKLQSEVLQSAI